MSETDDTDVLLIIPPNFFLVHSSASEESLLDSSRTVVHKPQSCTSQVLGKLVTRVHSLENRLDSLEVSAASESLSGRETRIYVNKSWDYTHSVNTQNLDRKSFTFPRRRRRKYLPRKQKRNEQSFTSLDSASSCSQKVPALVLKTDNQKSHLSVDVKAVNTTSDSQSMDGDISSIVSTPSKKNDKLLLHEIDEFLNKVEAYESPEGRYTLMGPSLSPENVIKATGDYITQKLDANLSDDVKLPSGRTVPSSVLDKYIYLVRNKPNINAEEETNYSSLAVNSQINQQQQSSDCMRKTSDISSKSNFDLPKSSHTSRSPIVRKLNFVDNNKDVQPTSTPKKSEYHSKVSTYTDTFRPSTHKVYDRASKVLEQYKASYSKNADSDTVNTSLIMSPKKDEFKVPPSRGYGTEHKSVSETCRGAQKLLDTIDTDLLSLSDLWGAKTDRMDSGKLEEERLKREHCEAMIQDLQKKLLEQQEKLAVAVKVDRAKDAAISKLREAWGKITSSLERTEARHKSMIDKMAAEVEQYKKAANDCLKKTEHFEAELYKTLDLAHDYQEKCKLLIKEKADLEERMKQCVKDKEEAVKAKIIDMDVLKDNYETVLRLNKQSNECMKNLESSLEKEKLEHNNTRSQLVNMTQKTECIQEETSLLVQERDLLKEKLNEERSRCTLLEKQLADKQAMMIAMQKREDTQDTEIVNLHKQLEGQKLELKCHYQQQLEQAVMAKLQEFQDQLDHAEQEMQNDARTKEAGIVDMYNKQIARIEQQHKLEVSVLEEKQKEEVKLYRLQLAQATERITHLEGKLVDYRRRRGQIASQLHNVMESQWRQALHILTNPTTDLSTAASTPICTDYAPPKLPPLTLPAGGLGAGDRLARTPHRHDLFNLEALSDTELQHYVKLLLTKPAADCEGRSQTPECKPHAGATGTAGELHEEPTTDRAETDRQKDKRRSVNKPPWKS